MARTRLFIVPHTHYDAEVFLTRATTLQLGSDNILDALYLLDRIPEYRYVLDQRCYVEGFTTLFPEQLDRMKQHIAAGRLELAGDMHAMPDANIPAGESYIRQILYGRAYFEQTLGSRSKVGWMLDSFGHHQQIPQLMRKAGFTSYVIQRGPLPEDPAAFWWRGIDGSPIRCEWTPHTYGLLGRAPATFPAFRDAIEQINELLAPYIYNNQFMVMSGLDLSAPDQNLPELIKRYNQSQNAIELVFATPSEYFAAQPDDGLIEIDRDLNPIFTGCYAARIKLKQRNRELEQKLFDSEKLMAINWAEQAAPVDSLEDAWEGVLFNQFHDIICGSHLDMVYDHALSRYQIAQVRADNAANRALDSIISRIDTQGEGIPLVVVNTLGHARTDVARCTIGLAHEAWESLALYDADGQPVPLQTADVHRHPDGSIKRADLIFIAEIPAMGYRVYYLRQGSTKLQTDLWGSMVGSWQMGGLVMGDHRPDFGQMGNQLVEVQANLRTGAIEKIQLRELDWNIVAPHDHGFASVCRQEDRGDPWEYYGPLRGAVTTTIPLIDPVPPRGQAIFSDQYGGQGRAFAGPVMAEMVLKSPFGDGTYASRIRLYAGLPRVEIETELVNRQQFVRYRNVFPINLDSPQITYEIPFGACVRPEGEYPAQNWVDIGDGQRGVAFLNRGIPGHSLVGNVLTTSLMKCAKVVSYDGGGYNQATKDDAGFELGVTHRFQQAILPHRATWQDAQVYQEGMAFNTPLIVRKVARHGGELPASGSFVEINPGTMVLHALYVEGREIVVRVAEAAGKPCAGRVELRWPIQAVRETDLVGESARSLPVQGRSFHFSATPYEIKTFRIELV